MEDAEVYAFDDACAKLSVVNSGVAKLVEIITSDAISDTVAALLGADCLGLHVLEVTFYPFNPHYPSSSKLHSLIN